jgi:hypothetical protein
MDIEKLILNGKIEVNGYEIHANEIRAKIFVKRNQLHIELDPDLPISKGWAGFLGSSVDKIVFSDGKAYIIVERGPDQTVKHDFNIPLLVEIFDNKYETEHFRIEAGETDVHIFKFKDSVQLKFLTSIKIFTKKIMGIRVEKTILLYSVVLTEDYVVLNTNCGSFNLNREDCGLVR